MWFAENLGVSNEKGCKYDVVIIISIISILHAIRNNNDKHTRIRRNP
jgi:hypothetical protein